MSARESTVLAAFLAAAQKNGSKPVLFDGNGETSLDGLLEEAAAAAEGLRQLGVAPGDRVGFYADNSRRWLLADLSIQCAGGVSVPRGTDTPAGDMIEIYAHAEVGLVLAGTAAAAAQLEAERAGAPTLGEIICIDGQDAPGRTLDQLIEAGREGPDFASCADKAQGDDLATIIYTSGTTGRPKGVMLTQANFAHQIRVVPPILEFGDTERFLSVLPPWHIFERTVEYVAICCGCELVYTSQRRFKEDLVRWSPTFVPSVPRIWETVYDAVQKKVRRAPAIRRGIFRFSLAAARARAWARARVRGHQGRVRRPRGPGRVGDGLARLSAALVLGLTFLPCALGQALVFSKLQQVTGGRLRGAVSGGGLMPPHVDNFFRAIGVPVLVGYGLTETSPVITLRRQRRNVLGTIGTLIPEVEIQIRHVDTGAALGIGERGVVFTRGPHVMRGYYKDEALTAKAVSPDGWFDTGDLAYLTEEGDLCFSGRAKETIVLQGGENVEPSTVETALLASPLIDQAVVVGQDRKTLAALIVVDRTSVAARLGLAGTPDLAAMSTRGNVVDCIRKACRERTAGLRPCERIQRIALLPEALDATNGCLTQTLKPRRHVIVGRFEAKIEEAYEA